MMETFLFPFLVHAPAVEALGGLKKIVSLELQRNKLENTVQAQAQLRQIRPEASISICPQTTTPVEVLTR